MRDLCGRCHSQATLSGAWRTHITRRAHERRDEGSGGSASRAAAGWPVCKCIDLYCVYIRSLRDVLRLSYLKFGTRRTSLVTRGASNFALQHLSAGEKGFLRARASRGFQVEKLPREWSSACACTSAVA